MRHDKKWQRFLKGLGLTSEGIKWANLLMEDTTNEPISVLCDVVKALALNPDAKECQILRSQGFTSANVAQIITYLMRRK